MSEAKIDENYKKTKLAVSNVDGKTTLLLQADPVSHRLKVSLGSSGVDLGNNFAERDQNYQDSLLAVSNVNESVVKLYCDDTTKELLIN